MLLIVFLGLIAKLALVLGVCDLGSPTLDDFDLNRFVGTWYGVNHLENDTQNNFSCLRQTFDLPVENRSLVNTDAFNMRDGSHNTGHAHITTWNSTGYFDVSHNLTLLDGKGRFIAVDYDRYVIACFCRDNMNERIIYVGYRSRHPDQETVNEAHRKMQDTGVNDRHLMDYSVENCKYQDPQQQV